MELPVVDRRYSEEWLIQDAVSLPPRSGWRQRRLSCEVFETDRDGYADGKLSEWLDTHPDCVVVHAQYVTSGKQDFEGIFILYYGPWEPAAIASGGDANG